MLFDAAKSYSAYGVPMASHGHNDSKLSHTASGGSVLWKPHKDWRVWAALLLMLAAIVTYVVTLDDSIIPR
jgi:hypothetical protein